MLSSISKSTYFFLPFPYQKLRPRKDHTKNRDNQYHELLSLHLVSHDQIVLVEHRKIPEGVVLEGVVLEEVVLVEDDKICGGVVFEVYFLQHLLIIWLYLIAI